MTDKRLDFETNKISEEFWINKEIEDNRKALGFEIQLFTAVLIFFLGSAVSLVVNIFVQWSVFLDVNPIENITVAFSIILILKLITLFILEMANVYILFKIKEKIESLKEGDYV